MDRRNFLLGSVAGYLAFASQEAAAQDQIVLRYHTLVPLQSSQITKVIGPWAKRIEEAAGGRIKIELYGNMSLGGSPASLFDQIKDGVADFTQMVVGYTPGRFPKTETFELPFLMTNAEATSAALYRFVQENALDEYNGIKLISNNTHGPGLLHLKRPVARLEDLKGMKIRGGSHIINDMLTRLGAEAISVPITQMAEALTTGVLDGTTLPWDLSNTTKVIELVQHHVEMPPGHGLYTQAFFFVMNLDHYNSLPDDLKALFDATPGIDIARIAGQVGDAGDVIARQVAADRGNTIVTLDEAEAKRWIEATQPTIEQWYKDSEGRGIDGRALHQRAQQLIAEESAKG